MRIITHPQDRPDPAKSIFATELELLFNTSSVDIACPYLNVEILEELIQRASRFRLVTDAEEWLRAVSRPQRGRVISFIAALSRECSSLPRSAREGSNFLARTILRLGQLYQEWTV